MPKYSFETDGSDEFEFSVKSPFRKERTAKNKQELADLVGDGVIDRSTYDSVTSAVDFMKKLPKRIN